MRCGVVCFNMIKIFWFIQRNSNLYVGKETSTVLSFDEKRLFQKQIEIVGLVAEPARPAEAGAECLPGPAGLGGKIYGITSLRITCNLWDIKIKYSTPVYCIAFNSS